MDRTLAIILVFLCTVSLCQIIRVNKDHIKIVDRATQCNGYLKLSRDEIKEVRAALIDRIKTQENVLEVIKLTASDETLNELNNSYRTCKNTLYKMNLGLELYEREEG